MRPGENCHPFWNITCLRSKWCHKIKHWILFSHWEREGQVVSESAVTMTPLIFWDDWMKQSLQLILTFSDFFFYSTDSILHQKGVALTASSGRVLLDSSSGRAPKGSLRLMSVLLSPAVPTVGEVEHDTWAEISLVMAKNTRRKHSRDHWICWEGDSMFSYMLTGLLKLSWKSMASYSAIILFQDIPVHMVLLLQRKIWWIYKHFFMWFWLNDTLFGLKIIPIMLVPVRSNKWISEVCHMPK